MTEEYEDYPEQIEEDSIPHYKESSGTAFTNEIVHFLFDHKETMDEFENELKGVEKYINEKGQIVVTEPMGKRMLNDYGIKMLKARLKPLIYKTTQLSNYKEERIMMMLKYEMDSVNELLFLKSDEFEIEADYMNSIIFIFERFAESSMKRALNGEGHKSIMTRISRVEQGSIQNQQQQPRNPIFGWMKPKTNNY